MQISDYLHNVYSAIKVSLIILLTGVGLVWLNQSSLEQYWASYFHQESPWSRLSSPRWKFGARITTAAETAKNSFIAQLSAPAEMQAADEQDLPLPLSLVSEKTANAEYPVDARQLSRWLTTLQQGEVIQHIGEQQTKEPVSIASSPLYDSQQAAILAEGKQVLFIGDSMMEGVAPRASRLLKDRYQVEGINLSKRSTGLAYPDFFNWPETTARTLENNPNIGLLAVFLGPNDPWDMPVAKGQPYLKFGSEAWKEEYCNRIRKILSLAEQYKIPVIWVIPPNMRKNKLNDGMAILAGLYETEVTHRGGIVLRVNDLFSYPPGIYSPTTVINNRLVTVRASDGIHYTPRGLELIAEAILEKIHFVPHESEYNDEK